MRLAPVVAYDTTGRAREQKRTDRRWAEQAKDDARRAGADDALVVSRDGLVGEASSANVFVVLASGGVVTPPVRGIVPGVVRAWVLGRGDAQERVVTLDDLESADEVFLTTAGRGVVPVGGIDERVLSGHPVAEELHAAWQALPREALGGGA